MKKKVLLVVGNFSSGGIERILVYLLQKIDKYHFDIDLAVNFLDKKSIFLPVLKQNKVTIFVYGSSSNTRTLYLNIWKVAKLMANKKYDIVHSNLTFFNAVIMLLGFFFRIKKRISHCHAFEKLGFNYQTFRYFTKLPLRWVILLFATDLWGVSQNANQYLYGKTKKAKIMPNGIDTNLFAYNQHIRKIMREKKNLNNSFVLGHVGRFAKEKNQVFLVEIFWHILQKIPEATLYLVGTGEEEKNIKTLISHYGLEHKVIIYPPISSIADFYQMIDCFVFPSLHEGFGVAAIEAQCSGLPCFISDNVPEEVAIINTKKLSLHCSSRQWADIIIRTTRDFIRTDQSNIIRKKGLDIQNIIANIEHEYVV